MSVNEMLQRGDAGGSGSSGNRRTSAGRKAVYALVALVILGLLLAGGFFLVAQSLVGQVGRYPSVFAGLDPNARPSGGKGETFLLMGTDSRSAEATTGSDAAAPDFVFGQQRTDAIMLATVAPDKSHASVVSVPRDSWVDIPGHGMNKINAAYSFGGPTLLIQTIENLTRVRVDHFAVIDFAGFQQMTDAAGGIDVTIPQSTSDMRASFGAGPQHLNGAQALNYVRQRYNLPGGDFDRVKRQQNALRALVRSTLSSGTLSDPGRAYNTVNTISQHVGVDDSLSNTALTELAFSLRGLRSNDISFLTAPTKGTGMQGDQSVVFLDPVGDQSLWQAVNDDTVDQWKASRPDAELPAVPN